MITEPTPMIIDGIAVIAVPDHTLPNDVSSCYACCNNSRCNGLRGDAFVDVCIDGYCHFKLNEDEALKEEATRDAS